MRFGVHLQTGEGYDAAVRYAAQVGCECAQVFAKSPRRWVGPAPDPGAYLRLSEGLRVAGISPLFTHAAYLLNLATEAEPLRTRSVEALADEFRRCAMLSASGVVAHLGATDAPGPDAARTIARAVGEARSLSPEAAHVPLLLENGAGQGRSYGASVEQLGAVLEELHRLRAGPADICFDTCHAQAAGIDVSDGDGWRAVLDTLEAACDLQAPALIHSNDCAYPLGARRDRHAWVGEGSIGESGFAAMVSEPRLQGLPAVVEASGVRPEKDLVNLARLKRLRTA